MNIRESSYGYWSSTQFFIWVAGGAAIGIGNIARLPYLMGQYGGLVFLLAYLASLMLVALPLLVTEWLIGRWSRADAVDAYARIIEAAKAHRAWLLLGWLSLAAAGLILSYYSVIAGWSAAYVFRAAGGSLAGGSEDAVRDVFFDLARDPERGLSWHTIFLVMACIIVAHGVREGLERAARVWVPIALLMACTVCAYALVNGNTGAAMAYLLTVDFAKFGWRGAAEALQLAFFTMGLGMGVMLTFGTYLPVKAPIVRSAIAVLLLDTVFSLLAGVALFALIFSAGLDPAPGLQLMFQLLPRALPAGGWGVWIAVLFYAMVFIVTMAAATALLEPVTRYVMERYRSPRVFAATSAALLIWFVGLGSLLSFSVMADLRLFGMNTFEWAQWLTGSLIVPLGGLLLCIFASRILPQDLQRALWGERHQRAYKTWSWLLRFPARIALIVVLMYSSGLLGWLESLWKP